MAERSLARVAADYITLVQLIQQAPGENLPDVDALGADIYLFSLYKVYGPHLGVMVMREAVNQQLPSQGHFFNEDHATDRFTPAGPDHAQIAAVNGVIEYFESVYAPHFDEQDIPAAKKGARVSELFQQAEQTNLQTLLEFINQKSNVRLIGKNHPENRAPTVSFTVDGVDPGQIAAQLADQKIGIGNGNCYAYRLMEALGIAPAQGVVRLSFVHYTTEQELLRLTGALDRIL